MLAKTILSSCSNIKSIFESNISTINSIKQFTEEIFQLTSGKPMPNRIDLISKKTTTMLRKEKTLLNSNRELSSNIDKIEKDILDLLKNIYNSQQINEQDIFKEITENIQRKNNELTKIKNINENLNNEIIKLKNMMNATSSYGKFSNEELIDICHNGNLYIENIKKEKEPQKRKSSNIDKKENKAKNVEQKNKNTKAEKDKDNKDNKDNKDKEKDNKDNKENKQLKEQIQTYQKTIEEQKEEIKKINEELSLVNEQKNKLEEELKNKE